MTLHIIGCASGLAGADVDAHTGDGPIVIRQSTQLKAMEEAEQVAWHAMLYPPTLSTQRKDLQLHTLYTELANEVRQLVTTGKQFCVVGGDHSCAIGTWSGVFSALHQKGEFGLIWIDAHMDSHTPETTPSGNIHGMPLASLLGYGYPTLTNIGGDSAKLKPENVCLIGVRSYEAGEAALLEKLNIKVYFMDEVERRGFSAVLNDAIAKVSNKTIGYGMTLDIDSLDPEQVPGVNVPEPGGIKVADLLEGLKNLTLDRRLLGTEIVEFDPTRDRHHQAEDVVIDILKAIAIKR